MDLINLPIAILSLFIGMGLTVWLYSLNKREDNQNKKEFNCSQGKHDWSNWSDSEHIDPTIDHYGYKCTETQSRTCKICNLKSKIYT